MKTARLNRQSPIRILQVVGGMERGGLETWLMHILRNIDRDRFKIDFLVHLDRECAYDEEVRLLGSRILICPYTNRPFKYARNFKKIINEFGPYDIVHSHVHHFSGYVLRLAKQAGIPCRIAHSHNDTSITQNRASWYRRFYLGLMSKWIQNYATLGLGCSYQAAADLFDRNWKNDPRWQILYCGIELSPFQIGYDIKEIRTSLGIPEHAFVIGHVGRFVEQKNHQFLLEIFAQTIRQEPNSYLLLIGKGDLESEIKTKVERLGIGDRVIFAGVRSDIPKLMLTAMDVFLFPSLYEGLGIVLLEAQAAGLPCIYADVVPEAVDLVKSSLERLSLAQHPKEWAEVIIACQQKQSNRDEALAIVVNSQFNIEKSLKHLEKIYQSQLFEERTP